MRTITLEVEGMKCAGCASTVESALSDVAGVQRVDVSLEGAEARVTADDPVREVDLVAAVLDAGYRASVKN